MKNVMVNFLCRFPEQVIEAMLCVGFAVFFCLLKSESDKHGGETDGTLHQMIIKWIGTLLL